MLYLDPSEHVILEVRKHWFVFVSTAVAHIVGALFPLFGYEIVVQLLPFHIPDFGDVSGKGLFFYSIWLLLFWISFFVQWTKYYLNVWYVTEKRIIDIEQSRLFDRTVSNLRFDKIQDITIEIKGVLSTMLHIGDIKVQTAAEDSGDFFMHNAANPDKVRSFIFSQHNFAAEQYIPEKNLNSEINSNIDGSHSI